MTVTVCVRACGCARARACVCAGASELVLQEEKQEGKVVSHIMLKLDWETWSWKRARRKVK